MPVVAFWVVATATARCGGGWVARIARYKLFPDPQPRQLQDSGSTVPTIFNGFRIKSGRPGRRPGVERGPPPD